MKLSAIIVATMTTITLPMSAQSLEDMTGRLDQSADVIQELLDAPDSEVPEGLLEDANCVAVIPSLKKVALGFGGEYGRGAAVCRSGEGGPWGPPSMIALDGGSFGFQIGASSIDVVMLFMGPEDIDYLLRDEVKLGADANVAAGPKGRNAEAATDLSFQAGILSYSRSQGLFAGISLEGASLRPDNDANEALYGRKLSASSILVDRSVNVPEAARPLVDALGSADLASD